MLLRHNKVTELFYVCDWTVRFSTYCRTNCSTLLNMTFLYSCDDRWFNQKPLSRGWFHPSSAAVVFCRKYFSIVRVTQVRFLFLLWKDMCCVLKNLVSISNNNEKQIIDISFVKKRKYILYYKSCQLPYLHPFFRLWDWTKLRSESRCYWLSCYCNNTDGTTPSQVLSSQKYGAHYIGNFTALNRYF